MCSSCKTASPWQWPPEPRGFEKQDLMPATHFLCRHPVGDILIGCLAPVVLMAIYGFVYYLVWSFFGNYRLVDDPRSLFALLCLPIAGNIALWLRTRHTYSVLARSLAVATTIEAILYGLILLLLFVLPIPAPS